MNSLAQLSSPAEMTLADYQGAGGSWPIACPLGSMVRPRVAPDLIGRWTWHFEVADGEDCLVRLAGDGGMVLISGQDWELVPA